MSKHASIKPPLILANNDYNRIPQWGVIARTVEDPVEVGMDLNALTTAVLTGVQGAGKSYCMGTIIENFLTPIPGVNELQAPGCALVFHYSQSQDYKPELTLMGQPNSNPREVNLLVSEWHGTPTGVPDIVILTPPDLVKMRQDEFPGYQVEPLLFNEAEVDVASYVNLMGDSGSTSFEIEVLLGMMQKHRHALTPQRLMEAVQEDKGLDEKQKYFLRFKLEKATQFISGKNYIGRLFKPGRLIIVDLRDEFLPRSQAFRLMLVLLSVFQRARNPDGSILPRILVADEAHEYANDAFLVESFARMVRLMRHISMTILIASQDPMSVHKTIKDLASLIIMLNMETDEWAADLAASKMAIKRRQLDAYVGIPPGTAWIWSRFATDQRFVHAPQKCIIRPRASMHGGFTKSAIQT